jgi:hypothetical protein
MKHKVAFTGDLFRDRHFEVESTSYNVRWIQGLFHDSLAAEGFSVFRFAGKSEGGSFDVKQFQALAGLEPTPDGWAKAVSSTIPETAAPLFADLTTASLVLGWGLPPSIMGFLQRSGVNFLDVEVDPIRFADDLFLRMRTNAPSIARILERYAESDRTLRREVASIRALTSRRDAETLKPGKSIAVFAGQMPIDLAVVKQGRIARPEDYLQEIRNVANDVEIFLVKPHPNSRSNEHILPLISYIPNSHLCNSNIYRILCDTNLRHVVSLSSSVLREASLFRIPSTHLLTCDRDDSLLIPDLARQWHRIRADVSFQDELFGSLRNQTWLEAVLISRRTDRDNSINLRSSFDGEWGLAELRANGSTTLDLPKLPQAATCTQQLWPSEIKPYLRSGWSAPEDWGTWSDGEFHFIEAQLEDFDNWSGVVATLHLTAYLPAGITFQRARIFQAGKLVAETTFVKEGPTTTAVAVEVQSPTFKVLIETPDAVSPVELGHGEDSRKLGIGLRLLAFSAQEPRTSLSPGS